LHDLAERACPLDEGFVSATLESSQITDDKVTLNFVDDNGAVSTEYCVAFWAAKEYLGQLANALIILLSTSAIVSCDAVDQKSPSQRHQHVPPQHCSNAQALSFTSSMSDLEKENFTTLPPLRNPPMLESTEDLTNLSYLNEPAVLNSIRTRYTNRAQIYTYSGIVLVAVNPFSAVPLYGNELVQAYAGKRKGEVGKA
jgi:hypothetical protein